ncbi:MAG: hypothetical protein ACR2QE_15525 [Acidimicrobiales bacterium]
MEVGAPSEPAGQHLRIATAEARALNDAVQTKRRTRLGSVSPNDQLLEAPPALDQSLRDILTTITSS